MSHEIVERALSLSRADAAIVIATETSSVNLRWANNTLTTNAATRSADVVIISIVGRSFGVRTANVVDEDKLEDLVRASEADARDSADADDYMELIAGDVSSNFDAAPDRTSVDVFEHFAPALGKTLQGFRDDEFSLFGFAQHSVATVWLGTSSGTRIRHTQPEGSVQWNAKSNKPGGSVWHGQATRDFTDVECAAIEQHLRTRLSWCDNMIELPAGRYETIMPPTTVADMLEYAYWHFAARDAMEGRTVLSKPGGGTRLGEQIGPKGLHMYSDPHDAALPTTPYVMAAASSAETSVFDNGMPVPHTDWIRDGMLTNLVSTRSFAAQSGLPVASYVGNLILEGDGNASVDEMVANTERGLLLTCLWYIREVDPQTLLLTGLTRDGVYLIEDGQIKGVVNNFRFNESPIDLLGRCTEVGRSEATLSREWGDYFNLSRMSCLRIPDFNMSSVSPAS